MLLNFQTFQHDSKAEQRRKGIIAGHAYSVIAAHTTTQGVLLMKVRNPWGKTEWKGAWSDYSPLWRTLSAKDAKIMKPDKEDDGIFWIDFEEFITTFQGVTICWVGCNSSETDTTRSKRVSDDRSVGTQFNKL